MVGVHKPVRVLVAIMVVALGSACAQDRGPKEQAGTVIGGVAGAVLGSQIGRGTGRDIAIAGGALLGAMIGNEIGRSLDKADRAYMAQASRQATKAPVGETIVWNNPESGNRGTVTPVRDGRHARTGAYCREFQQTVTIGGRMEEAYGIACRQPDGSWKIVNSS